MVRRYALAYNLRFMWTLTIAEEVTDLHQAWDMWVNFTRRMKRAGEMPAHWVVVPEQQKRGVWHFHVICDRYVRVETLREKWGHGFIWVKSGGAKGAGSYASKYVGKSFEENDQREEGERRFRACKGMKIETDSIELTDEEITEGKLGEIITEGGFIPLVAIPIKAHEETVGMWFLLERQSPSDLRSAARSEGLTLTIPPPLTLNSALDPPHYLSPDAAHEETSAAAGALSRGVIS